MNALNFHGVVSFLWWEYSVVLEVEIHVKLYDDLLVGGRTHSTCLVVLCTVHVWIIIEDSISLLLGPTSSLVHKMPVKASKRPVLRAFVLQK